MNKLLVIADDLTGALDTGVQFSKKGISALVLTAERLSCDDASLKDAGGPEIDVLVVDTESRHLPAEQARDVIVRLVACAFAHGFRYFYKKTDSALRGNVGAELAGLLEAGGACGNCLSFVPAFPKSRRITRNGIHYIDGIEVGQSIFSKDPFTPVTFSSVADIIHRQADVTTENITSDAYDLASLRPEKKTLRILDAESVEDLEAIGAQLRRGGNLNLIAGCAGFAEVLPELLDLPIRKLEWEKKADNLLVVSGSMNPITAEQLSYGEQIGFSAFTLSPEQKMDTAYPKSSSCANFVQRVAEELKKNGRVIIKSVNGADASANSETSRSVANNIGEIVLRILSTVNVANLAVFGGDTLYGVLSKMNCGGVVPLTEIVSGVVAAKLVQGFSDRPAGQECIVITKSGGLGEKEVLRHIEDFINECEGEVGEVGDADAMRRGCSPFRTSI